MRSFNAAAIFFGLQCWCFTSAFTALSPTSWTHCLSKSRTILSLSDQSSADSIPQDNDDKKENISDQNSPPRTRPAKLDPLLISVTRNNDPTYDPNAPKVSVPLMGELALDRSFFVFLPVAAFAVLGLITSIVVLVQSKDVFVDAVQQSTAEILTPPSTTNIDPNQCRGLCSQQDESLEEMRAFMNKFARK
ncbi:hypothetical protein FisN_16Hu296 [Fistulifera solaris]|jgi:hypothetical protein|uniref:Transmembrane protein n=1 Tax=Fistulifera solaris TaxID=1519565 RepID=A0A1Z5KSH7_FISSO|nr:hypothetical protein FisN_16Hu296 [Fistulifera solaris]|eukprot:GAX29274.1 hypothetical protein FisN_16Hu296 [Fistulifera solaris]